MPTPYTPLQNGPVESALASTINAGLAARLEVNKIFPDVHLKRVKGVWDRVVNRSATSANAGMLSLQGVFYKGGPPMLLLPPYQSACLRVLQQR